MKRFYSSLALSLSALVFGLFQTGCSSNGYVVNTGPGPAVYGPGYPVDSWGAAGFYGGSYYGNSRYYNNNYYNRSNSSGDVNTWRGGSASWNDGSGSASGARGGSASWSDGSGSATGWRGGSASWGGGSGSWHTARGGSGSFHR